MQNDPQHIKQEFHSDIVFYKQSISPLCTSIMYNIYLNKDFDLSSFTFVKRGHI